MKQIVYLLILGWVTSLLSITPDKTRESSSSPPGIYNKIIPTVTRGSMYQKCKEKKGYPDRITMVPKIVFRYTVNTL